MKTPRILLVDDEPYVVHALNYILTREGFVTETARNGEEALFKMVSSRPDLVILDIGIPLFDGIQVCRQIKKNPGLKYIYVLILTAKAEEKDHREALTAGADFLMTKPFSPKALVTHIREQFIGFVQTVNVERSPVT